MMWNVWYVLRVLGDNMSLNKGSGQLNVSESVFLVGINVLETLLGTCMDRWWQFWSFNLKSVAVTTKIHVTTTADNHQKSPTICHLPAPKIIAFTVYQRKRLNFPWSASKQWTSNKSKCDKNSRLKKKTFCTSAQQQHLNSL